MSKNTKSRKILSAPSRPVLLGVFSLAVIGGLLTWQIVRAEGRILPNVTIGGLDVGNRAPEEARAILEERLRVLNLSGVEFAYEDRVVRIAANAKSAAPPEQSIVTYDLDGMVEDAYLAGNAQGRGGFIAANLQAIFSSITIPVRISVNEEILRTLLEEEYGDLENEAVNADITIEKVRRFDPEDTDAEDAEPRSEYRVHITPATLGVTFDYDAAIQKAISGLERWQGGSYLLEMSEDRPAVTTAKAESMKDLALDVRERGGLTIGYDDMTWNLGEEDFTAALTLKARSDGSVYVGLRDDVMEPVLDRAANKIDQEPRGTRLVLNEERTRAVEFEGGQVGKELNRGASISLVEEHLLSDGIATIPLVVDITPAPDSDPVAEEYGIRELVGWGTSDFSGSPLNRRRNIKNGVDKLWGWVIPPGGEFGLLEKLRPFNSAGGYVQELVIKGNRTIREYGGGLCQIGTTAFRAVMGAGMPITERRNHSYQVSYYAPAGTDATLYDPAPDFKFVNDTDHHMLFITRMIGDILRFELWGTRDGRVQERTEIKRWNPVPPPAPRLIPTSALAPGARRCFETGHSGLTTSFDYIITYPNGEKKEQTFTSYYKPWQAQCLIGQEGAPNIQLQWDGSLKEFPPEGSGEKVEDIKIVPENAQCTAGGCTG